LPQKAQKAQKTILCLMRVLWLNVFMQVFVNGDERQLSGTPSLEDLITQLELPAARIAIELNREVVRRSDWSSTMLKDDDRIEIVHFVGGGVE
jgi:thiamine biosynthesis protein ThiS